MKFILPELLSPAGNLEKLKIAFAYGADACYIGINVFGLRKFADNFSLDEVEYAVKYANTLNKKVYLVLNGYAFNSDLSLLAKVLPQLNRIKPHAFIISDLGVIDLVKQNTDIDIHVSTQASVINTYGCLFWKNYGAKRIILARECNLNDCKLMLQKCDIEIEVFIHGAMCSSYSGKCVISNYTSGRDSNRGGCVQTCRHKFSISDVNSDSSFTSNIMNSNDLNALYLLPDLLKAGIHSYKIEGRMKSNLYLANAVFSYRKAIDYCYQRLISGESIEYDFLDSLYNRLEFSSNRSFCSGGFEKNFLKQSINYNFSSYSKLVDYVGSVKYVQNDTSFIEVKSPFKPGESLTYFSPFTKPTSFIVSSISNSNFENILSAKSSSIVLLKNLPDRNNFGLIFRSCN